MEQKNSLGQKTLRYLLQTKYEPAKIRRSQRIIKSVSLLLVVVLIVGPIVYFRELGYEKYVLIICSTFAGLLAFYGQANSAGTEQLEALHDYIDFEKVRSAIEDGET